VAIAGAELPKDYLHIRTFEAPQRGLAELRVPHVLHAARPRAGGSIAALCRFSTSEAAALPTRIRRRRQALAAQPEVGKDRAEVEPRAGQLAEELLGVEALAVAPQLSQHLPGLG
jgi:hypothetical protein